MQARTRSERLQALTPAATAYVWRGTDHPGVPFGQAADVAASLLPWGGATIRGAIAYGCANAQSDRPHDLVAATAWRALALLEAVPQAPTP